MDDLGFFCPARQAYIGPRLIISHQEQPQFIQAIGPAGKAPPAGKVRDGPLGRNGAHLKRKSALGQNNGRLAPYAELQVAVPFHLAIKV